MRSKHHATHDLPQAALERTAGLVCALTAGAQPPLRDAASAAQPEVELPPCHTELKLSGTVYDPEHMERSFALFHVQANHPGEVYRAGERVAAFEILDVAPRGVLLRGEQGECWLWLAGTSATATAPKPQRPAPKPAPRRLSQAAFTPEELDAAIHALAPQRYEVKHALLPDLVARAGAVMRRVHYQQVRHYSHIAGLQLTDFPQDGLLARLGLQRGDVIKTLNGLPLTSVEGALQAQQLLESTQRLSLLVQRSGQAMTLDYQIVP